MLLAIRVPAVVGGVLTAERLMDFLGDAEFSLCALHFLVMASLVPLRFLNNGYGMGAAVPTLLTEMLTEMLTEILLALLPHMQGIVAIGVGVWVYVAVGRLTGAWRPGNLRSLRSV